jgi:putative transposase
MSPFSIWLKAFRHCARPAHRVVVDLVEVLLIAAKSRSALGAVRKQLAMFQERNVRPHRAQDSARWGGTIMDQETLHTKLISVGC